MSNASSNHIREMNLFFDTTEKLIEYDRLRFSITADRLAEKLGYNYMDFVFWFLVLNLDEENRLTHLPCRYNYLIDFMLHESCTDHKEFKGSVVIFADWALELALAMEFFMKEHTSVDYVRICKTRIEAEIVAEGENASYVIMCGNPVNPDDFSLVSSMRALKDPPRFILWDLFKRTPPEIKKLYSFDAIYSDYDLDGFFQHTQLLRPYWGVKRFLHILRK